MRRGLDERQLEHGIGEHGAGAAAGDLRDDVGDRLSGRVSPRHRRHQRDHGIEMRAAGRAEQGDQRGERGHGRAGVRQQRDRRVSTREALAHDSGADDGGGQQQ